MYKNALKDCLANLSFSQNGNHVTHYNKRYYRGLIVGIVSSLRWQGMTFDDAIFKVRENLPDDCIALDDEIVPESWLEYLK